MARRLAAAAAVLTGFGLAVVVWYVGWGVHGCDDWGGNPVCEQMERDHDLYVAGVCAIGVALLLAIAAMSSAARARSPMIASAPPSSRLLSSDGRISTLRAF